MRVRGRAHDARALLRAPGGPEGAQAAAGRAAERRQDQDLRRKARAQAAAERELARRARAAVREITSRRRGPRSDYEVWLDERAARLPLTRADLHSQNDEIAAGVVAAGGGMQAVIAATDFRTRKDACSC